MKRQPVCKKSGELVRSALRETSSLPSSPADAEPKVVHFKPHLEQVRYFSENEEPTSFSTEPKRLAEWDIITSNFSEDLAGRQQHAVRVEQLNLSDDYQSLIGTIIVANFGFEKYVAIRFTCDYWQTISEVAAEYRHPSVDGHDEFEFVIKLPHQATLQNQTLLFCARYQVNGQEYWDNNWAKNFQVNFRRAFPATAQKPSQAFAEVDRERQVKTHIRGQRRDRGWIECNMPGLKTTHISLNLSPNTESVVTRILENRSRADLNSTAYADLIQRYCFFTPSNSAIESAYIGVTS